MSEFACGINIQVYCKQTLVASSKRCMLSNPNIIECNFSEYNMHQLCYRYLSLMISCERFRQLDKNRIIITSLPTNSLELTHLNNSSKVLSSTAHASDQCRLDPLKFTGTLTSSIQGGIQANYVPQIRIIQTLLAQHNARCLLTAASAHLAELTHAQQFETRGRVVVAAQAFG